MTRHLKILFTLLATTALALTALHPFLRGQMPLTADGTLHLYRLITLDHALADGTLWPRYAAGMVYGYGAPMFNYYAPLSLYPLQTLHLAGMSFLNAWLAGMIFYLLLAGIGAFLLGQTWAGDIGGWITAAAYVYAPYTLYDAVARGTVAELASLALLPWVLWALSRLAKYGRRGDFALVAFTTVLFIPMHNVITLHGAALIGIYALLLAFLSQNRLKVLIRLVAALMVGGLLVAFFWMPAVLETRYIKLEAITANLPFIDVTANLTDLSTVFAPPITADPSQMQPPTPITLGWPQILLAALAVVLAFRAKRFRALAVVSVLVVVVLIFMNTQAAAPLWRVIPLIRYSQYPWRLLGLASLLLALLAGISIVLLIEWTRRASLRIGILVGVITVTILYGVPWTYSLYLTDVNPQTIVDAQNFERESGFVGTSSFGEYLPIWNFEMPDTNRLTERFLSHENGIIPRLEAPEGVTILSANWWNTRADLTLSAEQETELVFDWFYLPGWWAALDGQPLEVHPTSPEGLVSVNVSAGEHRLEIGLGLTDLQRTAVIASGIGLVALLVIVLWRANPLLSEGIGSENHGHGESHPYAPPRFAVIVIALGISLFALKALIIDRIDTPLRREHFVQGVLSDVQNSADTNFGNQVHLIGFDLAHAEIKSGQSAPLNLYWRLYDSAITTDYSTVVTLRDSAGNQVHQVIAWQPGGLSTSNWLPGYYLQERTRLEIPPETPPGAYTIDVSLYDPQSQRSLNVINPEGNPTGVNFSLGMLNVTRPDTPPATNSLEPEITIGQDFGGLRLIGLNAPPENATVGQELTLAWVWQKVGEIDPAVQARLIWRKDGEIVAGTPFVPPVNGYPLDQWQTGDMWRGLQRLYVPGLLDSGEYEVAVEVSGEQIGIGHMNVTAPERTFEVPDFAHPTEVEWVNGIRLLGYDLEGGTLTLYWQPQAEITQNLRVFVHVLEADEHITEQADRIPADWTRPTTGWAIGEIVIDRYTFTAIEGFSVRIGWYDSITNVRINTTDAADNWTFTP